MKGRGYLLLLLHAHLPYVRHPEQEYSLEERWLFEAITDCYLPLLDALERLCDRGVPYRITLSVSPPLLSMLGDELLRARYRRHLTDLIELTRREQARTAANHQLRALADYYRQRLEYTAERYREHYGGDLLSAFRRLAERGRLTLITTAATHGYLPLLRTEPVAVKAQLRVAAQSFRTALGRPAQGIWLPECGYYPELDGELHGTGFRWFFLESHGITNARPRPPHGVRVPLVCGPGLAGGGRATPIAPGTSGAANRVTRDTPCTGNITATSVSNWTTGRSAPWQAGPPGSNTTASRTGRASGRPCTSRMPPAGRPVFTPASSWPPGGGRPG
jgi:1,4-alpha-glucan branching enzyme